MQTINQLKQELKKQNEKVIKIDNKIQLEYNKIFDDIKDINELIKNVDSLENYDYMSCNDIDGVDYVYDISHIRGLFKEDELKYLEEYLDNSETCSSVSGLYSSSPIVVSSSAEEIFMLNDRGTKKVITPMNRDVTYYLNDHHAFLIAEEWREDNGIYCGLFVVNDYDNTCEHYNYSLLENNIMAYCEKDKNEKLQSLLDYYLIQDDNAVLDEEFGPYWQLLDSSYVVGKDNKSVEITYNILLEELSDFTEYGLKEITDKYQLEILTDDNSNMARLTKTVKVKF